jgi:hypothetical protein
MRNQDPEITAYYEWLRLHLKRIPFSKTTQEYLDSIADLPQPVLAIFAAHCCDSEIGNGGFLQLFYNPTGIVVPEAYDGYVAVGKPELAAIVQRAAKLLGEPYPREWGERQEALLVTSGKSLSEVEEIARETEHPYLGFQKVVEEMDFDKMSTEYYERAIRQRWFFDSAAAGLIARLRIDR